jgi:predicted murein hydrolase (TIGR00659 family)
MNYLPVLSFFLTIFLYYIAKWLYYRKQRFYFSPLLIVPLLLAALLYSARIPYEIYFSGAKWLNLMLQPATVALAVPLYKYRGVLKSHAPEIISGVFFGSILAMISSILIAKGLNLDQLLIESLIPRSVTTPVALDVSRLIGGAPSITAVMVILTGILGSFLGPCVIRLCNIESDIARGVLLGTSSHALGTIRAFQFSSTAGAVSCVSMILAAIFTIATAKLLTSFLI